MMVLRFRRKPEVNVYLLIDRPMVRMQSTETIYLYGCHDYQAFLVLGVILLSYK